MACKREERKKQKNVQDSSAAAKRKGLLQLMLPSVSEPGVDWAPTDWGVG